MTANVSFMASGHGQVPWHKTNYVTVEGTMTSEEALRLAKLDFDVLQENVYDSEGSVVKGYKLNFKSDDRTLLGLVSDKYKVVQNTEAFAFTDALIGEKCRYETAGSLNNFRTTWLLARLEPKTILGDKYDNFLCFMNSFDGSSAVKVCVTPVRVVCQNTLNLALRRAKRTFSMRHTANIADKLQEAQTTLQLSEDYLVEVGRTYEELAAKRITQRRLDSFLEQLFPVKEEQRNTTKEARQIRRRDAVKECYNVDDLGNLRGTAFGFINAVSDMAAHMEPLRITDSHYGNLFGKVMEGHPYLDKAMELVEAM